MTRYEKRPVEEVLKELDYLPKAMAIRLTGKEDADLEQIARIKFWQHYEDHYDGHSHPRTFFFNVAKVAMIDELRRRTLRSTREGAELDEAWMAPEFQTPESHINKWVLKEKTDVLIRKLPTKRMQAIIRLHFFEELNGKEIAKLLGVSEGTVSLDMKKALRLMKESLK